MKGRLKKEEQGIIVKVNGKEYSKAVTKFKNCDLQCNFDTTSIMLSMISKFSKDSFTTF